VSTVTGCRCITLHAHWAEAIFALGKDVENRTWATDYRGTLAIHAGAIIDRSICATLHLNPNKLCRSAIIGTVELVNCVRDSRSKWAMAAHYHWVLAHPRRLDRIIRRHGQQGLYTVTLD
jgi:hypothetical protein